jgi:ubiquinone biosynthesis accessory factor UbiJ
MLAQAFVASVNHVLRQSDWSQPRLAPHAGKHLRLALGPLTFEVQLTPEGLLAAAPAGAAMDLTVELPAAALARWATQREAVLRDARIEGDAELAAAISFVAANARWDYEEDLSRVVGDIAAHRVGETLRGMERWRRNTAESMRANIAEYLAEEIEVVPTRLETEDFIQEVDELRDAVERLDKRIARLGEKQK